MQYAEEDAFDYSDHGTNVIVINSITVKGMV